MDQFELSLAQNSQLRPDIIDNYDTDEATRERATLLGVPMKLIRSADDVMTQRQARAKAADEAQKAQVMTQGASSFADAAGKRLATGA